MNCEKTHIKCITSDSSAFKHWHNSSNGNVAKEASGTFEQDQIWVDIVQPCTRICDTLLIYLNIGLSSDHKQINLSMKPV